MSDELQEGWGFPGNSNKAHFFLRGDPRSICMKWMYTGTRENDNHDSRDNCAECKKRRAKTFTKGAGDAG